MSSPNHPTSDVEDAFSSNFSDYIPTSQTRIANLEQIIEDIQVRHQTDKESLLNAIYEYKNSQEGPSDN
ncbi:hypothetical protein Tco_0960650 [Tanacetum coccineum]